MKKIIILALAFGVSASSLAQDSTTMSQYVGNAANKYIAIDRNTQKASLTQGTTVSKLTKSESLRKFICTSYSLARLNDPNYVDITMYYSGTDKTAPGKASVKYGANGRDYVNCVANTL